MKSYKTVCNACGGDNFYVTPDNGVGYCFNCRHTERDNAAPYARVRKRSDNVGEIRGYYTEMADYYHSSLDANACAFLYGRGYTDETISKLKIGYIPNGIHPLYRNPIAIEAGLADKRANAFLGGRISFPYFKNDTVVTDIRARSLTATDEIKYKSPFNDAYYRGAIYPYNYQSVRKAKRVLLTEGEIKAGIAIQANFPTVALPGILSWRDGLVQEDDQEYVIVFDNETKPNVQRDVIFAIRRVSLHLLNVKVATLPIFSGGKSEIDTFINKFGANIFAGIIDNALDYDDWNALQRF